MAIIKGFFVDVFFDTLMGMLYWFANKKKINKLVRVFVYSITLLPLSYFFVYCILTNFNVESALDTVMLYFFTILTLIAYLYSFKIIFKK
ncbi:MAG: hypothetical protein K0R71_140 [Bacillales bacterium]|jgi:hypothetical protein|nr:hypothetical protein [Bacillales bacterium]